MRRQTGQALGEPFCRDTELAEITGRLLDRQCRAVFLAADMGLGTTSILRRLAASAPGNAPVIFLHGTPSLSAVPFGVLAPYLKRATATLVVSHIDAIREMLGLFAERSEEISRATGEAAGMPLLAIDEGDFIDRSTAEVAVSLAQSGSAKLVVSHRPLREPVDPLPQLWHDGLAEKIQLQPLDRDAGHEFCVGVLGGRMAPGTSWYFWSSAGGNPLLMWLLMADAVENGWVKKRSGVWLAPPEGRPQGRALQDVVRMQLRGLSPQARHSLNLVALSEPVSAAVIADIAGREALAELRERHLVHASLTGSGQIQLINPIYGDIIRTMVPRAESLILHRQLEERVQADSFLPQALIRRVVWALDNSEQVPSDKLLLAAMFASKLFQSPLALRLAGAVTGTGYTQRARAVKARAHYNLGNYAKAAELLDGAEERATNVSELLVGVLVRAETRAAMREPAELGFASGQAVRVAGERLALEDPANAAIIRAQADGRAQVLDALTLSRQGDYQQLGLLAGRALAIPERTNDPEFWINRAIMLALEAERLTAGGLPVQGMARASEALAIRQTEGHEVFFVPETILERMLCASLAAGEWGQVADLLRAVDTDLPAAVVSFGGSAAAARGLMLLRQGRLAEALASLGAAGDALAASDPQHLAGCCTAVTFYVAAALGEREEALRLLGQYRPDHGMFVTSSYEGAYLAAGRGHLEAARRRGANGKKYDGGVPAELTAIADQWADRGMVLAEINALVLALDFDVDAVSPRLRRVAERMEGPWAAALAGFGRAVEEGTGHGMLDAAERLMATEMFRLATTAFQLAESRSVQGRHGSVAHFARSGLVRARVALGLAADPQTQAGALAVKELLTRRELEISQLAADGLTDKDIAAQLHVSVRTVEGHLYRSYGKLGITARSELALVIGK
ncbi:DNA-binding CsgD family transcriptional regulator/tetratricopeptide (TPR) repeat protein [Arthrobacter silviterrae]|uniref:Response regulator transcription factor n=1 Tax=Arthrobacter silviterrae TaxID=2026658 RepID=A0ABX0D9R2_9MICC|nr:LuxR C-terminal-related transcriptional regulator [Arthrobacter silviterrae]MDQ0279267.1 DNA-binding CsgD family transcriptional regulator/tetratricopeptide (TPR) repeat protein [Arthrobacter silviterrae]NGN83614.1 response regulator transcription factor [Arthrobacter silviterrae]